MRVVSTGFQVYVSARVGAEGIGLFQLVMSVMAMATTLGNAGIRVAATLLVAEEFGLKRYGGVKKAMNCSMLYGIVFSIIAAVVVYVLAEWISVNWIADLRAVTPIKLSAFVIPFSILSSILAGYFTAAGKIGRYVILELFERAFSIVVTVAMLRYIGNGDVANSCSAIIAGSGIATVISVVALFIMYCHDSRDFSGPSDKILRRLVTAAVPLALNEYLRSGLSTMEHMLIPRGLRSYGESGEQALASYGTIHGMVFPVILFPSAALFAVADVLVPELASSRASGAKNRIKYIVEHVMQICVVFSALAATLFFCLADEFGMLLYKSAEAGRFISLLAPLCVVMYLDNIVDGMLKGLGQQVHSVRYNTITSIMDIALLIVLLPRYGINGYIVAFTVTKSFNFYLSIARIMKVADYSPRPELIIKTALSAFAAIVLSGFIMEIVGTAQGLAHLLTQGSILIIIYCAVLSITKAVSRSDIKWLTNIVRQAG